MSILIKGMKMPESEEMLCINIYPDGKVYINLDLEECKQIATAVSVPPHGKLIDVDYANEYAYDELEVSHGYLTNWEAARAMQKIYQNAPTIISAEKSE